MENDNVPKISTPFINLLSDYGFKRTFGTKEFQNNVVKLLEAALGDDIKIDKIVPYFENPENKEGEALQYHDKELLPADPDGKRIVYDVYFTMKTEKGASLFKRQHLLKENKEKEIEHHFILEMQNVNAPPFEDRMAFYLSKMVACQGKSGWNYDLDPVILIGITNFDFPYLTKQLIQEFELREKKTGESLTNKLRMLFYSLNQVPEEWEECEDELQRRLFIIKNMHMMDKNSKPYRDGGYRELFEAAESSNLVGEEAILYSRSLSHLNEVQAGLDFRYEEGVRKGIKEGIKEGMKEGIIAMARKMKAAGTDVSFISQITELSPEIIKAL